ncbi:hypothetical protein [Steroidobacter agaridevorans]|uniref:hypothetical protein n=1 Tax=Steroidobacter agaridevorans TaxID=2695856 RepID=UPI001327E2A8|nr:hypothetical protein [Steroidobacter agaridevorans]GFE88536.1 hypothetical protein GCM10011488_34900 [Steroidobacter agaridevorans]
MAETTAIGNIGGVHVAPRAHQHSDFVPLLLLCTPIACASLLSKFGIPGYASLGIGIAIPLMMLVLAFGMLNNCVRIEPRRLGFYCITLAVLILPQLLQAGMFSLDSLMMLAVLHIPYVLVVVRGDELVPKALTFFLYIARLLACLAVAQYFLQGIVDNALLYPIDNLLPPDFIVQGFNAQGTVSYYSTQVRATGMFMLEPSFLTQFLAVAIVAESVTTRRLWPLGLYVAGILVAHAGTGIAILLICMPFVVLLHRRWDLALLGVLAAAAVLVFGEMLGLNFIANRANEFSDPNSSGFARFVGGFYMFEEMLWPNLPRALFGYGAGAFMDYAHLFTIEVADMPVTKMIFEFGLVGAFTYFAFIFSSLFASPLPRMVSVAIALTFLLNGMYVPFSHGLALGLLVLTSTRKVQLVTSNVPARKRI